MKAAVIDVGSNSVRLLVATVAGGRVEQLARERVYVRLGDDAFRQGRIGSRKLKQARAVAGRYARIARRAGAEHLETIVTAPGRQVANSDELVRVLSRATGSSVVVLSAEDEGRLAWEGAHSRVGEFPGTIAVVDLGGGSCEVAVGSTELGALWVRSIEAGALRITRGLLRDDPPGAKKVARARAEVCALAEPITPSSVDLALAVGGTARALGRIVGPRFGAESLDSLVETLARVSAKTAFEAHGVTTHRAQTLLGGTIVLAEIARRLGVPFEVGRAGLREGALLALAAAEAEAA